MTTHLHKDYGTSFCGRDASHIKMTHNEAEADCASCEQGLAKHLKEEAAKRDDEAKELERLAEEKRAEQAEMHRKNKEIREQAEREAEERELSRLKVERALGLRE